jgi:hypothetical protein
LNGCKNWSLKLSEGYRLKVFGNRVLRVILGPKREDVAGGWRELHNEALHSFAIYQILLG